MNIKTDDNNITAILDTRDGKAYRDHAFDVFGKCLEQHLMNAINEKVEAMLPGQHDMKLGNELHEAFAIVSSFLEPARQEDKQTGVTSTNPGVSQEALRSTAMFVAAAFYMQAFDFRLFKETFNEVFAGYGKGMSQEQRLAGYLLYLMQNIDGVKNRQGMCTNVMKGMIGIINDVIVHKGLRDVAEDK